MSRQPGTLRQRIAGAILVIVLLPLWLPLLVIGLVLFALNRVVLYLLVWMLWLPRGKDTLFVYSDSPIWQEYMTQQVLPLVENRAVVLNWSQRSTWKKWRLGQQVFYSFSGRHDFNPMVIMFRPLRRAKLFRFWSAFKDWKHGHTEGVERLRNDLRMSL
jgi:hypothetical protein